MSTHRQDDWDVVQLELSSEFADLCKTSMHVLITEHFSDTDGETLQIPRRKTGIALVSVVECGCSHAFLVQSYSSEGQEATDIDEVVLLRTHGGGIEERTYFTQHLSVCVGGEALLSFTNELAVLHCAGCVEHKEDGLEGEFLVVAVYNGADFLQILHRKGLSASHVYWACH